MWTPELPDTPEPLWRRLLQAMRRDVETGALAPGEQVPTQRALAHRMGLGVGTVTRAYAEAEALGLLRGEVGRGSFVTSPRSPPRTAGLVDLARNLPPFAPASAAIAATVARLARRHDLAEQLAYAPPGGDEAARRTLASWLGATAGWPGLQPARVIVTGGAQQGTAAALGALCRPGDAVIAEAATFHGLKHLAAQAALRLIPAAIDAEGLSPAALDQAAQASGARVAYVLPVQNPTGRVMGSGRRAEIVAVARRRGLTLIEDDLYAPFAPGLAPLASLAPDRVWYVSSLSKSLAPGLRIGCVVPPAGDAFDAALGVMRTMAFGSPTFGALLAAELIESGAAAEILASVRTELAARTRLAAEILGAAMEPNVMAAPPHIWLPMSELEAERVSGRALRAGVEVTPPRAMYQDGAPVEGLRLCLGPPGDRATLEQALLAVRASLTPDRSEALQLV